MIFIHEIYVGLQVNDIDINPLIACSYPTHERLNLGFTKLILLCFSLSPEIIHDQN